MGNRDDLGNCHEIGNIHEQVFNSQNCRFFDSKVFLNRLSNPIQITYTRTNLIKDRIAARNI